MDSFIQMSVEDKEFILRQTAAQIGVHPIIVEKDFWVVWILSCLNSLENVPDMVFRGGTSLSKVYKMIYRFSEDIDLSFDRKYFGFNEGKMFRRASNSKREELLRNLRRDARNYIENVLMKDLENQFAIKLDKLNWKLRYESPAKDSVIYFDYPQFLRDDYLKLPYVQYSIKLEIAIQPCFFPNHLRTIKSYAAEMYPEEFKIVSTDVMVLNITQTFWEKLLMLHRNFQKEVINVFPERFSRHCYDIYMLHEQKVIQKSLKNKNHLKAVIEHLNLFYY